MWHEIGVIYAIFWADSFQYPKHINRITISHAKKPPKTIPSQSLEKQIAIHAQSSRIEHWYWECVDFNVFSLRVLHS